MYYVHYKFKFIKLLLELKYILIDESREEKKL